MVTMATIINNNNNNNNNDTEMELPIDMQFNTGHVISIIGYSLLFVFSTIANWTVLILLLKRRKLQPTRINTMLIHLAIADLTVTYLTMPLEIAWAITVSWKSTDFMCRLMAFFRIFGIYLSGFLLCCISIDRFYAVLKPLNFINLDKREKYMLIGAWISAFIFSLPQAYVFHLDAHPKFPDYYQCISFDGPSGTYNTYEMVYYAFGLLVMYAFPLIVIIFCYASILLEIYRRTRNPHSADSITRSSLGFLGKAKARTLKMTILIVFVFFICWTPYNIICIWYWIDHKSASAIDLRLQRLLFLFACTNSCANPVVYGIFNIRARRNKSTQVLRPKLNSTDISSSIRRTTNHCMRIPPRITTETRLSPLEISLRSLE